MYGSSGEYLQRSQMCLPKNLHDCAVGVASGWTESVFFRRYVVTRNEKNVGGEAELMVIEGIENPQIGRVLVII